MTFTKTGASNFVTGRLDGELLGKPYQEQLSIGLDPDTNMLAFVEKRPDGVELVSVASWRSPIAITFQTSPVQANGKIYQLRRLLSVTLGDGVRRDRGVLRRRRPIPPPRQRTFQTFNRNIGVIFFLQDAVAQPFRTAAKTSVKNSHPASSPALERVSVA